ncbi:hypothetical protein HPP92_022562 [Vanilla planifolia]|uniref:SET domain-containing protein n=1 Tax=Vanilla planifolia TaxID=51239 RepID=A0A835UDR5_VANPL|nr:hypothetical protein HPP92_022562 [Vanilla planifolia]
MERLKSVVPDELKLLIAKSTVEDLYLTCSSLLEFFQSLPQFRSVIGEVMGCEVALCRKSSESALDWKKKGNACFIEGDYTKALNFYSKALQYAPTSVGNMDQEFVGVLYANRASALHKMGLFEECIRDCGRAIAVYPVYAKAWYRRGKANASLKRHETAILDLEISLSLEGSLSGKNQIKEDIQLLHSLIGTRSLSFSNCDTRIEIMHGDSAEQCNTKLECVTTPDKGRGMISSNDISPATLIHCEEPLAAIVVKSCRETHCHLCFSELPMDALFCTSCTIPVYCSEHCLEKAVGIKFIQSELIYSLQNNLSEQHWQHAMHSISWNTQNNADVFHLPEHEHECGGSHWSAVLPTDIVLAGRVMMRSTERIKLTEGYLNHVGTLEFSHNYDQIPPNEKLEIHVYAILLAHCLCRHLPSIELAISKFILLISQIKLNSMAIVHMKSLKDHDTFKKSSNLAANEHVFTSTIDQVRVGLAIYSTGRLFNHSCKPNIHAYFLSRTLHLRSIEHVPARYPLEISYGPQVGQLDLQQRQQILEEQYSFRCHCIGCSELNLSDLVINSFKCPKQDCFGAILGSTCYEKNEDGSLMVSAASFHHKISMPLFIECKRNISKVAHLLFEKDNLWKLNPGCCLNCFACVDLKSSSTMSNKSMLDIDWLKSSVFADEERSISDIPRSLSELRSIRHPFSKFIAQAEDKVAEAFAMIGQFDIAKQHCEASIEILEKLYHKEHIAVAHEWMKLASLHLSLGDHAKALRTIVKAEAIFSLHYGSHVTKMFSFVEDLKKEAISLGL